MCASVQRRDLIFLLRELRFWISFTSSCEDLFNLSAEDVNVILTESERESIGSTRLLLGEPLVGHLSKICGSLEYLLHIRVLLYDSPFVQVDRLGTEFFSLKYAVV